MQKLEPGLYAQRFVVEGRWTEVAGSRPIHIERGSHFMVDKEGVTSSNFFATFIRYNCLQSQTNN